MSSNENIKGILPKKMIQCFYNTNIIQQSIKKEFTLKSGKKSNIYVDFRKLPSYPSLLMNVCKEMNKYCNTIIGKSLYSGENTSRRRSRFSLYNFKIRKSKSLENNYVDKNDAPKTHIIGVPTGGYSLAQAISINYSYSCLFLRTNVKTHGLKRELEGEWQRGDCVILVDDVITSGNTLLKCINRLESIGVTILKVVVILCRDIEGVKKIWNMKRIRVNYMFDIEDVMIQNNDIDSTHNYKSLNEKSRLMECPF